MQNVCKCCATHPRQQSTNVDSLERRRRERGAIWGIEPLKRFEVELIEWRTIDVHITNPCKDWVKLATVCF
jgi:hypothetical protein